VPPQKNELDVVPHTYTPVIPATQEAEAGGPRSWAGLGKVSVRPYEKNKLKAKRAGAWLKW
jgi:hypothetical protein